VGKSTSRAPRCSSAPATSAASMSVTLNSPVRDIDVGDGGAGGVARYAAGDGREKVVLAGTHQGGVHGGARRDDAHDLAFDQTLGGFRILHLVADGDAVSLLNKARDVCPRPHEKARRNGDAGAFFLYCAR